MRFFLRRRRGAGLGKGKEERSAGGQPKKPEQWIDGQKKQERKVGYVHFKRKGGLGLYSLHRMLALMGKVASEIGLK